MLVGGGDHLRDPELETANKDSPRLNCRIRIRLFKGVWRENLSNAEQQTVNQRGCRTLPHGLQTSECP